MISMYNDIISTISFRKLSPQKHDKTMERLLFCIFTVLCFISASTGRKGFGPGEQEWGFVEVRPYANMFWWLYYTTADVKSYYDKPLIIWLEGGPGGSSTAYGNFERLGPLDLYLNPRNYTWVKDYNVLFIDNPIGAGFSITIRKSGFATTNAQIASDLLKFMQEFYNQLPKFKSVPTYIFGQSYGGKMGVEFALVWARAQKAGNIESNLKGIALGNAWISPIDSVISWAPFLLNTSMIDSRGFEAIDDMAKYTKTVVETGKWKMATEYWDFTEKIIKMTSNLDFYNILEKKEYDYLNLFLSQSILSFDEDSIHQPLLQNPPKLLYDLMNGPVKKALGLEITHGNGAKLVFKYLTEDFMKPVTNIVELLLNETNLKVFVYNGNLDLCVTTRSTLLWVEKLKWKGAHTWKYDSFREPLVVGDIVEGYVKTTDNFAMYWISRAGHNVPKDNPAAMELILQDLTSHTNE